MLPYVKQHCVTVKNIEGDFRRSPTATQIYARMAFDPIREAMEKAQNDMLSAAGISNVA